MYKRQVLQVSGAKDWTVCAPVANAPKLSTCATYDAGEMSALDLCSRLTLYPGDLLFVPERSVHSARALDDAPSRAAKESEIPNFKGSYLGRFPLVSADFWTSDHLSERPRSVDAFPGTRARGTLTLKRR